MKLQKPHKNSPQNTSKAAEAETKIHREIDISRINTGNYWWIKTIIIIQQGSINKWLTF